MKNMTGMEILAIPMQRNDAGAATVGEYLVKLSAEVWREGECFSGKRPFGNSSWELEVYEALARAGAIVGRIDTDGYLEDFDEPGARVRVDAAFKALYEFVTTATID